MTLPQSRGLEQIGARRLATLRLVANGLSSAQIAARSGCSLDTVNSHLRVITAVLGARSRTHAVALAIRLGVLPVDDVTVPEALSAPESRDPVSDAVQVPESATRRQSAA